MPTIKLKFEPRDLWIGIFWDKRFDSSYNFDKARLHIYICIVPMFPICIVW